VSFILDALKKAAEQRGTHATAVLRPSAPVTRNALSRRTLLLAGGALVTINLAALALLLVPEERPAPAGTPAAPSAHISMLNDVVQPAPAPPPPLQVIETERPRASAPAAAAPRRTPEPRATAAARPAEAPRSTPTPVAPEPAARPVEPSTRAIEPPARAVEPRPRATGPGPVERKPAPSTPVAAATPPPGAAGKLKLEVLSYSEIPAQRLVFINGRRYKEGDTVDGGARVEEIREDGVILSDDGQRFTLR
jgi:general secretion pathway protein B